MSRRKSKPVKVVWRKLGKEKAWGQATIGEVLIHEVTHLAHPGMSEAEVDRTGKMICKVLWSENYRRVVLAPNAKPPRIS